MCRGVSHPLVFLLEVFDMGLRGDSWRTLEPESRGLRLVSVTLEKLSTEVPAVETGVEIPGLLSAWSEWPIFKHRVERVDLWGPSFSKVLYPNKPHSSAATGSVAKVFQFPVGLDIPARVISGSGKIGNNAEASVGGENWCRLSFGWFCTWRQFALCRLLFSEIHSP